MIAALFWSAVAGLLVAWIGSLFDKTPDNRNAWTAGLIVFVLLVLNRLV